MKKFLPFVVLSLSIQIISAQYCGNSGPSQCTANGTVLQPGLSPLSDSLPPFVNNVNSTTVIQFRNFNVVYFGMPPAPYTLQSLRIDTIDNLPSGLCWASDKANSTYVNSENGCIKVNGIPCDSTGQYKLRIIASATIPPGITVQVDASSVGLHYYVRVINNGDAVTPVDTLSLVPFVPYGAVCTGSPPPVVNLGADQSVCSGSNVTLNPVVTGGIPPYTYSWQATGNTLSCSTCLNPSVTLTQNSTFTVTVTDAASNTGVDAISYTVSGGAGSFQITANGPTSICTGNSVTLHAAQNVSFTNQWQRNGVDIPGETDSVYVVADSSGAYSVAYSNGVCNASSNTITVAVNESPSVSVSPAGSVSICQGSNVVLQSTSTLTVTYLWQLNGNNLNTATNSSYTASLGGSYRVVVKTTANCTDTSSAVAVTVNPLPTVTLSGNPDTLCTNSSPITLSGGTPSGGTYSGIGVTGNTFNPVASGTGSHSISYVYTDGNTCIKSATETIVVRLCTGISNVEEEKSILVYPNPAYDKLTIQSDLFTNSNVMLSLFDVTGKEQTIGHKLQNDMIILNVASIAKGVYTVKINVSGKEIIRKFIKTD